MFILCFTYPLIIWQAKSLWLFIVAMAIWGFYYDLMNFGTLDFVSRKIHPEKHSASYGIITIFKELGYLLAPIIAGFVIGSFNIVKPVILMGIFISSAVIFYGILTYFTRKEKTEYISASKHKPFNVIVETSIWKHIGFTLLPVLLLSLFFNIFDSFFWTLGPILAQRYTALKPFNGLFMTVYTIPTLLFGWYVGSLTKRFGKKRTAFVSFLVGSLVLSLFATMRSSIFILADVFFSASFTSIVTPAINGAYADYLEETALVEKEIEALNDFFTNIGYIIGPMIAGILADKLGIAQTFSVLGIGCAGLAVVLIFITPKKITVDLAFLRPYGIVAVLLIALAVPVSAYIVTHQSTENRQRAAEYCSQTYWHQVAQSQNSFQGNSLYVQLYRLDDVANPNHHCGKFYMHTDIYSITNLSSTTLTTNLCSSTDACNTKMHKITPSFSPIKYEAHFDSDKFSGNCIYTSSKLHYASITITATTNVVCN